MRTQTVFRAKSPSFTLRCFLLALVVAMPCAALAMVLDPLASKGMFSEDNLLHERATVLAHWIGRLKPHPAVAAKGIGVAGESQAGYVMPLAVAEATDIAFMIALSCPAVDGVTQFAYLIEKQLLCDGIPEQEARKAHDAFLQREKTRSYQEYRKAAEFLATIPATKEWVRGEFTAETAGLGGGSHPPNTQPAPPTAARGTASHRSTTGGPTSSCRTGAAGPAHLRRRNSPPVRSPRPC